MLDLVDMDDNRRSTFVPLRMAVLVLCICILAALKVSFFEMARKNMRLRDTDNHYLERYSL